MLLVDNPLLQAPFPFVLSCPGFSLRGPTNLSLFAFRLHTYCNQSADYYSPGLLSAAAPALPRHTVQAEGRKALQTSAVRSKKVKLKNNRLWGQSEIQVDSKSPSQV